MLIFQKCVGTGYFSVYHDEKLEAEHRQVISMKNIKKVLMYTELYISERIFEVAPATFRSEKSKIKRINKLIGKCNITEIQHSDVKQLIVKLHKRYSNKSINGFLTILRALFIRAVRDGLLIRNPMDGIDNLIIDRPEPNPFTKDELIRLRETDAPCISGKNLALLAVLTGLRISEIIALAWEDINWLKKELYVKRARVLNDYKVPKTAGSVRIVELNALAIDVLKAQFESTGKSKPRCVLVLQQDYKRKIKTHLSFVFINTKSRRPFLNAKQYGKAFFTSFLQIAKVKHRGSSQLRHTFASQALTAGISKEWIAGQMGHTSTKMIDDHYGRWIKADAPNCAKMMSVHLGDAFGQKQIKPTPPIDARPDISKLIAELEKSPQLLAIIRAAIRGEI
ncbi:site-specific integrase [Vibrio scophthalmi]|uniref:tyrosine-type recombinase/integrase n=1 Tax=Vibrio scophthalmi TaxID=45658 RepID=UPI0038735BF0